MKEYRNEQGQLHRLDGPAVEWADGGKRWYVDGKPHRIDGPAVEWSGGHKSWYVYGKRHRTDGPTLEWDDGHKSWYVDGKRLTEEQFNERRQGDETVQERSRPAT